MRVTCLQLGYPAGETKVQRINRVLRLIAEVADADLVVLPELWVSGFFAFDRYADEAETLDGPTVTALREAAATHGTHLMAGSLVERHTSGLSNCALLIGPDGSLLHTYRKIHLFGHESDEARLLTPGGDLHVAPTAIGAMATSTCYDLRFPELYRLLVERGAQIVIVPAAWPMARLEHWRLLLRARAVENQVFVVACNGAGWQHGVALAGHSVVVDPWGQIVAEASDAQQILTAEIAVDDVADIRTRFPVLAHRRIATDPVIRHRPLPSP